MLQYSNLWESDIIEELWFPFKTNNGYRIPYPYFVNITVDTFDKLIPLENNIYGLHFCGELKPWKFSNIDDYLKAFYQTCEFYSELRNNLVKWYANHYIEPLRQQYPEIFK